MTPAQLKRLRAGLGLSQSEFAGALGISTRTLQQWEQGINKPRGTGLALLKLAEKNPRMFVTKK